LERPELPYGIELDPVLSSKGHFEATCTPFLPPDALVPVDYAPWVLTGLRTEPDGALGWSQRVLTVPNDKVYRAYSPVSSLSLSADNRAVQSGSPDESDLRLIGTGKSADESFSCVLPPSFQTVDGATSFLGTSVLLNDAWAVTEHVECHTCEDGSWEHLRVFRAPRLRPAAHGWTGQNGNSTRDNREH
jgi:hypothetical protein